MCLRALTHLPPALLTRFIGAAVVAVSAGALIFALVAQYGFDLQPCILCLYQRWPYRVAILLGALAFLAPRLGRPLLWLCVPVFLSGAGWAFFQVGVEEHVWQGFAGCSSPDLSTLTPAEILAQLNATTKIVPCDVVQFRLLGLSMAAYNGLLSIGLAGALCAALLFSLPSRGEGSRVGRHRVSN